MANSNNTNNSLEGREIHSAPQSSQTAKRPVVIKREELEKNEQVSKLVKVDEEIKGRHIVEVHEPSIEELKKSLQTRSKKPQKVVISRDELIGNHEKTKPDAEKAPQNIDAGTTILDESKLADDAKSDRKEEAKQYPQAQMTTPDTTVLGFDMFANANAVEEPEPKPEIEEKSEPKDELAGRKISTVPASADKKPKKPKKVKKDEPKKPKVVSKIKKIKKSEKAEPVKISREELEGKNKPKKATKAINDAELNEEPSDVQKLIKGDKAKKPKKVKEPEPEKPVIKQYRYKLIRLSTLEEVTVKGDRFIVGKSKHSTYQIKGNNTVSRSHAMLYINDAGELNIKDMASKNGTFVDGEMLKENDSKKLVDGSVIRMSDEAFEISAEEV